MLKKHHITILILIMFALAIRLDPLAWANEKEASCSHYEYFSSHVKHGETAHKDSEDSHAHDDAELGHPEDNHAHKDTECDHSEDHPEDDDAEHSHGDELPAIHLDSGSKALIDIRTIKAERGSLSSIIRLTGKINLNEDKVAHVVPYVAGIVQKVTKKLGSSVSSGEVMAVVHSRQLSEAKASYLASLQRYELFNSVFEREQKLYKQKISSEQEFIKAKIDFAEANINKMVSEQKLLALGLDRLSIGNVLNESQDIFMKYKITAPFDGIVIDKHITLGEVVKDDSSVFTVADLNSVWIDLDVFPKDLGSVSVGQKCHIDIGSNVLEGVISFISPILNTDTRTATARVIADNTKGNLKPGLFVTATMFSKHDSGHIIIPLEAVQTIDDEKVVFVKHDGKYSLRHIKIGQSSATHIEVVSGIDENEYVVTNGAFDLKAKIVTSSLDSHAGHGH